MRSTCRIGHIFLWLLLPILLFSQPYQATPIVQFGHPGYVIKKIMMSPDGELMGTSDGEFLKVWDLSSGLELRSFRGDQGGLSFTGFSADGNFVNYTSNQYLYTADVRTGKIVERISLEEFMKREQERLNLEEGEFVYAGKVLNEKNYQEFLVTAYNDDRSLKAVVKEEVVTITRTETEEEVQVIELPGAEEVREQQEKNSRGIRAGLNKLGANSKDNQAAFLAYFHTMIFSPDDQVLLVDSTVYDIQTGEERFTVSPARFGIRMTTRMFKPNTSDLIICGVLLPELKDEEEREEMTEEDALEELNDILLGMYGINTEKGNTVLFVDGETGKITSEPTTSVESASLSVEERYLLTGHLDKAVYVWDLATEEKKLEIRLQPDEDATAISAYGVSHVMQGENRDHLIVACAGTIPEDRITMWDIETGRRIRSFGAAIPPVSLEVKPSRSDSIIIQEYKDFLFPFEQMNYRIYGNYRMLSLTNGQAPALFPKFDSITFSPRLDYYAAKPTEFETVKIYYAPYNELISELENSQGSFEYLVFNRDASMVAGYSAKTIFVWKVADGSLYQQIPQNKPNLRFMDFDPTGEYLVCSYDPREVKIYDLDNPEELVYHQKPGIVPTLNTWADWATSTWMQLTTKEDGNKVWAVNEGDQSVSLVQNNTLMAVDRTMTTTNKLTSFAKLVIFREYYDIDLSDDRHYAAAWRDDMASVQFVDLEEGKKMTRVQDREVVLTSAATSLWTSRTTANDEQKQYIRAFLKDRLAFREFTAVSPNWNLFAVATKYYEEEDLRIRVIPITESKKGGIMNLIKGKEPEGTFRLVDSEEYGEGIVFSPDGQMIAASSNALNNIRIWNANDGKVIQTLEGHSGKIAFTSNSKTLISSGWDRQVKVWDLENNVELYSFIAIKGQNDYVTILPSGYYSTSRKDSRAIAFALGKDAYPFDQFDVQFNRPDLVLQELENSIATDVDTNPNAVLIKAYFSSYQKRLEKQGLNEADFQRYFSLPKVEVADHAMSQDSRTLNLKISASDEAVNLKNLFVMINGVPIFEQGYKNLAGGSSKTYQGTVDLSLSHGQNRIQVYVVNQRGATSLKYNAVVEYTGPIASRTLHIVTLGTSKFKDATYDLDYPEKDLDDFYNFYLQRATEYDDIKEYRLEGERFTLAEFRKLKTTLARTAPDDEVIIFISTHGMLNENYDYFLATYDVDFSRPDVLGLSYEEVESFLRSIGARNKLVFMDACHSGELDDTAMEAANKAREVEGGLNIKAARSTGWEQLPGQQSFDLMKQLFVDLRSGTGATVIASASAIQYAYERDEWLNSAFAYCLLNGLKNGAADLNNDQSVSIAEIQAYLSYSVARLTNGGQQPINRTENIFNNYEIW